MLYGILGALYLFFGYFSVNEYKKDCIGEVDTWGDLLHIIIIGTLVLIVAPIIGFILIMEGRDYYFFNKKIGRFRISSKLPWKKTPQDKKEELQKKLAKLQES